ncbi:MAG: GNAT family N-acetyltransferase/peptidase C39 family protein [Burkholderiaceae bacterium]
MNLNEGVDAVIVRRAVANDLDALQALEQTSFTTDRMSRRSLRSMIASPSAIFLVAEAAAASGAGPRLAGYCLLLFRAGTSMARIYSIAVQPDLMGRGIGRMLMHATERAAIQADKVVIRLEVAESNHAALALYDAFGYRVTRRLPGYYEDGSNALRLEKPLRDALTPPRDIAYYPQSTEFTCGPACLMMAMRRFDPDLSFDPVTEVRLWREATTIFMTTGLGGCEPFGMAVALRERGFEVAVHVNEAAPLLLQTVTNPEKRRVMALAQQDFGQRACALAIPVRDALDAAQLAGHLDAGAIAVTLISGNRMFGLRVPHWVVVHASVDSHLLVLDTWVDPDRLETNSTAINIPIPFDEFDRMSRYGKSGLRASLLVTGLTGASNEADPAAG